MPPSPLFSEGFAEAFSGYRSSFENRYDDLVSLPSHCLGIDDPAGSVDELGGHFLRWLYEQYGAEPLKQLMRLSDGTGAANARAAFRTAYGMDIENAEQRYYVEAPDYYPGWSRCFSELELVPWQGDAWQPVVELDCAVEHTRGVRQMQRTLGFDLGAAGPYVFEVEAPATAFISTCQTEIVPLGVSPPLHVKLSGARGHRQRKSVGRRLERGGALRGSARRAAPARPRRRPVPRHRECFRHRKHDHSAVARTPARHRGGGPGRMTAVTRPAAARPR